MRLVFTLFALLVFCFSCARSTPEDPLVAARKKLANARSISFEMEAVWNNTFVGDSSVELADKGAYVLNEGKDFPYDFLYETENGDYLYLNGKLEDVELDNGRIITYTPQEAQKDLANEGSYQTMMSPMVFVKDTSWRRAGAVGNIVYYERVLNDSEDEYGHAYTFARLHIDSLTAEVRMREQFYSLDGEPMQHLQRIYSRFSFDDLDSIVYDYPEGFQTIANTDLEHQKENELIKVGDHLPDFDLADVDGNAYSEKTLEGKKTVFVFSFIGCGGCELARKDLAKSGFRFSDDYVALYVNPMNTAEQIANYHLNKPWPYKLAATNYDFSAKFGVYSYPTFITVDESGRIEEVIEGYEEEEFAEYLRGKGSVL